MSVNHECESSPKPFTPSALAGMYFDAVKLRSDTLALQADPALIISRVSEIAGVRRTILLEIIRLPSRNQRMEALTRIRQLAQSERERGSTILGGDVDLYLKKDIAAYKESAKKVA